MENKIESAESIAFDLKSFQNANVFIKCVSQFDFLTTIIKDRKFKARYVEENIEYLKLKFYNKEVNSITFPMICFCDIPINKLKEHIKWYGEYAICLKKTWGIKSAKLSPIHYINLESKLVERYSEYLNDTLNNKDVTEIELQYMLDQIFYYKPYKGVQNYVEKNQLLPEPKPKLFMDEQEWRYVYLPEKESAEKEINAFYINGNDDSLKNDYNDVIETHKNNSLEFQLDDVRYIVVPNEKEKENLINFIENELNIEKFEKYNIVSKILVMEEVEEDFT
ncbi:abortive infection system antitoxin AbiGi family protein [Macrococcus capreoli]|uniref:abortive infection system antitoxin AbiGi family protein n=1 Tax=Macrococcus capreoli TaxID=2982690 RepID=UPI003EE72F09